MLFRYLLLAPRWSGADAGSGFVGDILQIFGVYLSECPDVLPAVWLDCSNETFLLNFVWATVFDHPDCFLEWIIHVRFMDVYKPAQETSALVAT